MDNRFENKGKDQNVAQGDGAIAKQVNVYNTTPPVEPPRQLPPLDACFLGRDKELAELVGQLHPGKVVAVCGPGGMGKSALAAQAVHKQEHFPDGIVFHKFYDKPGTDQALQTIAEAFQVQVKMKESLATAVQAVLAGKKALLILDGAEDAENLKAVLDLRSTCGVLITSRKRSDAQGFRLDLKPLEDKPAVDVFCEYSGATEDDASVLGVCEILDGWPVGLRIAGRYLCITDESAADYLRWLEQEPFKELGDGEHQEENAALLLRRSVAQVSKGARLALSVAGTLAFAPIAREPVAAVLDGDDRRARTALNELINYGLLEKQEERWQINHALIYTYARSELTLSRESLERLAGYYIDFWQKLSKTGLRGYALLHGEQMHCMHLMKACLNKEIWKEVLGLARVIDQSGGDKTVLIMRWTAARQIGERKDEAWCLNQLGQIYFMGSEHTKAFVCYRQSLTIYRELGDKEGERVSLNDIRMLQTVSFVIASGGWLWRRG